MSRGRELFTVWDKDDITTIPYCGTPDLEALKAFVQHHRINIRVDSLMKVFETEIIIEE